MNRSIIFDTETTGLDPDQGDRVIEIAALELINDLRTDNFYHVLIDPERDIPVEATKVHGFTIDDLRGKPKFSDIAQSFLDFIGESKLIAHNAPFDFKFINAELKKCHRAPLNYDKRAIDTVIMARRKFPGMPASLDALCRRFDIDLSERGTHNALLDCRLLADVYVELIGGRQHGLGLGDNHVQTGEKQPLKRKPIIGRVARHMAAPEQEILERHKAFILKNLKSNKWGYED